MRITGNKIWNRNSDIYKKSAENVRVGQKAMLGIAIKDILPNSTFRERIKLKDIAEYVTRIKWRQRGHVARTSNDKSIKKYWDGVYEKINVNLEEIYVHQGTIMAAG